MQTLRRLRNYYFYCGIEKDEYNALKKDAYVSNFEVWKILHFLMFAAFGVLFVVSSILSAMESNRWFYLFAFFYSCIAILLFFYLKKDSIVAQLVIYLSISVLFLFGCFITQNKPESNAVTFIVLLLITPMFMIDKPFFMTIELFAASTVFLVWMHGVKPHDVWVFDLMNVIPFTIVGCILNVIANSIRIREFVLTKEINEQKDTDELTGLKNKSALTGEINEFLADGSKNKGIMFLLDADHFKSINDTYGHDVGDRVITQIGSFLGKRFTGEEVAGRFGGDEFIVFVKNTNDMETAHKIANEIVEGAAQSVELPDKDKKITVSIGISIYSGLEKNYSEIFKKADIALYQAKADPDNRFRVFEELN